MTLMLALHRIDTGRRFARIQHQSPADHRWMRMQEMVAEEFDCDVDAVDLVETDDGEVLTVHGEQVANVSLEGSAFRDVPMQEAAE